MSQYPKRQRFGEASNNSSIGIENEYSSMDANANATIGRNNDGDGLNSELKWKMAVLEVKNKGQKPNVGRQSGNPSIAGSNSCIEERKKKALTLKEIEEKAQLTKDKKNQQKIEKLTKKIDGLKEQLNQSANPDVLWHQLVKSKRLRNPILNRWKRSNLADVIISRDGLISTNNNVNKTQNVIAEQGFPISGENCRTDHFPGTIIYYFEVTRMESHWHFHVGLSDGLIPADGLDVGFAPNSYAIPDYPPFSCLLSGTDHEFEWPDGVANEPKCKGPGDVLGCGLLVDPNNKVAIFFTANGILLGKQIPISPSVDVLYPTIAICNSFEANFGNDLATKPFKYDINCWPGLVPDE